jgi:uncharacterized protein
MRAKILFLIELLVIGTVFNLDYLNLLPVSKVPYLFLLGWISIRVRGHRWRDVGLTVGQPFLKILLIGAAVGIGIEALELFATQPFLTRLLHRGPDLDSLQRLVGNTLLLALGIFLAWALAAFGEECVYRGYLANRCAEILGDSKTAWIVSTILVTLLFGFAHFHQGLTGVIENIIDGAILAAVYFATGRNLMAPIIAHGIADTIDVVLIYLGWYPGFQASVGMPT